MNPCQYRHIFGKVGEGVHSFRILNVAIVDLGLTIIGAKIIGDYYGFSFIKTILILLVSSIFIHKLFCVETTLTKLILK